MSQNFFDYWEKTDHKSFLQDDWGNPARTWAAKKISQAGGSSMVEVGPGPGIDYGLFLRKLPIAYTGWEGTTNFCEKLREKFPEATWDNKALLELPKRSFDVVYCKAVLEHQPALEPNLTRLLDAARKAVVLVWYRPPGDQEIKDFSDGVWYCTFRREDCLRSIDRVGWRLVEERVFENGNLGWVLCPVV